MNNAVTDVTASAEEKMKKVNESGDDDSAKAVWNPLEIKTTTPSVAVKHSCIKSPSCNMDWGLLGCIKLYKLEAAEERGVFCKEHNSCNRCGTLTRPGDFSLLSNGAKGIRHKCDRANGKMIARCTGERCCLQRCNV